MHGPVLGGEYDSAPHMPFAPLVSGKEAFVSKLQGQEERKNLLSGKKQDKSYSGIMPVFLFIRQ